MTPLTDASARPSAVRSVLGVVRGHWRWICFALGLAVAGTAAALVQPLLVKRVVDSAGTGGKVWVTASLLIGLFVLHAAIQVATHYLLARSTEGVVLGVRVRFVDHVLKLPVRYYERFRSGDLISRAAVDTVALRLAVSEGLVGAITGIIGLTGAVALMLWVDWLLFVMVAGFIAIVTVVIVVALSRIRASARSVQEALGRLSSDLERALGAIRTIRAARAEKREADRLGDHAKDAWEASLQVAKLESLVGPAGSLAVTGSFLLVLLVGGVRVQSGAGTVGDLAAFLLYMTYLTVPVGTVFQALSVFEQGVGAIERINEILDLPQEGTDQVRVHTETKRPLEWADARNGRVPVLEFRNVSFGYDAKRPVLRDVSFEVNGYVALVGPSGAGKSTILALIERFYEPDAGEIVMDGRPITSLSHEVHRKRLCLVEQTSPVLHGTLRENLLLVNTDREESELEDALRRAGLADFTARLPDGLDTNVGDHGMMLSVGERQRLAIARALLLTSPRLLLLDEPTASLDPVNEAAISETIKRVSQECAVLMIGHRLRTVREADEVLVVDNGRIVATGKHEDLLKRDPFYRGLTVSHFGTVVSA